MLVFNTENNWRRFSDDLISKSFLNTKKNANIKNLLTEISLLFPDKDGGYGNAYKRYYRSG